MTTAARPTFEPAKGGMMKGETDLGQLSKQVSTRDMPSQMTLKYRGDGQVTAFCLTLDDDFLVGQRGRLRNDRFQEETRAGRAKGPRRQK